MKNKISIESVIIPKDKLDILKALVENYEGIDTKKRDLIRINVGGSCIVCQGFPTKKITHRMRGALKIEWYCETCFSKSSLKYVNQKNDKKYRRNGPYK